MKMKARVAILFAALFASALCCASELKPSYDYIETGWSWLHAEHNGDGLGINGSVSLSERAFVYGSTSFIGLDHGAADVDTWRIGAGFHVPVTHGWDVVGRVSGQHSAELGHESYGIQYEGGLKGKFTPQIESWLMIGESRWNDSHFQDQAFLRIGMLYEFTHHFGIVTDIVVGEHEKEYFVGASFLF